MASRNAGALVLDLASRTRKKSGQWSAPKEFRIASSHVDSVPDPVDAEVVATMFGGYDRGYQNFVPGAVTPDKGQVALTAYNNATQRLTLDDAKRIAENFTKTVDAVAPQADAGR